MRMNFQVARRSPLAGIEDYRAIGRPGMPIAMRRFVQSRLSGLGTAADVLAQGQAFANSPFTQNPNFAASQAAALQNECNVDPYSPACQVAIQTNDINTGYNPIADTQLNLISYCKQNQQNAAVFGTPVDPQCPGGAPTQAILNQAAQITRGGGSGTQGGGAVLNLGPAPTPPPIPKAVAPMQPTVQTSNTTGTSGASTGQTIAGQPQAGSNAGSDAGTKQTDYTPWLLAAAVVVIMMVNK